MGKLISTQTSRGLGRGTVFCGHFVLDLGEADEAAVQCVVFLALFDFILRRVRGYFTKACRCRNVSWRAIPSQVLPVCGDGRPVKPRG